MCGQATCQAPQNTHVMPTSQPNYKGTRLAEEHRRHSSPRNAIQEHEASVLRLTPPTRPCTFSMTDINVADRPTGRIGQAATLKVRKDENPVFLKSFLLSSPKGTKASLFLRRICNSGWPATRALSFGDGVRGYLRPAASLTLTSHLLSHHS